MTKIISANYKYILFFLSVLYSLSFILWLQTPDSYYWANQTDYYDRSFMTSLSLWIGHTWILLFGHEIVALKFLGWLFSIIGILLPYFIILPRADYYKHLNCLSLGIVLLGWWTEQCYTIYSPTVFFMVCILLILYKVKHLGIKSLIVLALLSGVVALCRFPNIIVLPIIAFMLIVRNIVYKRDLPKLQFKAAFLYLVFSLCFYFLILQLLNGHDIISNAVSSLKDTQDESEQSHSIFSLILSNVDGIINGWTKCAACAMYIVFVHFLGLNNCSPKWLQWLLPLGIIPFYWYPARMGILENFYYGSQRSLIFIILFLLIALYLRTRDRSILFNSLALIAVAFASAAGSDGGILKMFNVLVSFLPLLLIYFEKDYMNSIIVKSYVFIISGLLMCSHLSWFPLDPVWFNNIPGNTCQIASKYYADRIGDVYQLYEENQSESDRNIFYGDRFVAPIMTFVTSSSANCNVGYHQNMHTYLELNKIYERLSADSGYTLFIIGQDEDECIEFEQNLNKIKYEFVKENKGVRIYKSF